MTRSACLLPLGLVLLSLSPLGLAAAKKPVDLSPEARVARVLANTPLVDGHNDLPYEVRIRHGGDPVAAHLELDQSKQPVPKDRAALMTDMPRLHAGKVGGQFWSVWIPASITGPQAVQLTLEEIDIARRLVDAYPHDLEMAYTAADVRRIHPAPKATLAQVADHVEHIRAIAGVDHVGIGSDFDGIEDAPVGLGNVSRYPALLEELARRGWSDDDLAKLAGDNILRVLARAEAVAVELRQTAPKLQVIGDLEH